MFKKRRRKFARLNTHILLKYKGIEGKPILSFLKSVSVGGALIYCKEEIAVGTILELAINFLGYSQPIKVVSKVLRVKRLKKIGGFYVAVEFINIEDKARDFINNKILDIYRIQRKNGGEGKRY